MKNIQDSIETLRNRYNGDNDIIPGDPIVTWADEELVYIAEGLLERIEALEAKLEKLQSIANPGSWKDER
jgi:hypothetical protein